MLPVVVPFVNNADRPREYGNGGVSNFAIWPPPAKIAHGVYGSHPERDSLLRICAVFPKKYKLEKALGVECIRRPFNY